MLLGLLFDPEDGGDILPKYRLNFNELHRVIAQQMELFIATAPRTSNSTYLRPSSLFITSFPFFFFYSFVSCWKLRICSKYNTFLCLIINPPCYIGTQNKEEVLVRTNRLLRGTTDDCSWEANKIQLAIVLTVDQYLH
jgi:hypothetical protein